MCVNIACNNSADKPVPVPQNLFCNLRDPRGISRAAQHRLAVLLCRQVSTITQLKILDNLENIRREPHIQQPVAFVQDKHIQVIYQRLDIHVAQMVKQPAGSRNQNIQAGKCRDFLVDVRAANRDSNVDFHVCSDCFCFCGNLQSEFTGWTDNQHLDSFFQRVLQAMLDCWDEKRDCFPLACFCLHVQICA